MRKVLFVLLLAACAKKPPEASSDTMRPAGHDAGSAQATSAAALAMTDVRLLEPENVIAQRISDVNAFSEHLKGVAAAIAAFDAAHPGALPAQVDVSVVMRATGTRVWLVGRAGDLAAPGLDAEVAKLPKLPIKERHVAVIVTMVRAGAKPEVNDSAVPFPSAWKDAAASGAADVDSVIDKVWPQ